MEILSCLENYLPILVIYTISLLASAYAFKNITKAQSLLTPKGFYLPLLSLLMLPLFSRAIGNVSLAKVASGEFSELDVLELLGLSTVSCLASVAIITKVFKNLDLDSAIKSLKNESEAAIDYMLHTRQNGQSSFIEELQSIKNNPEKVYSSEELNSKVSIRNFIRLSLVSIKKAPNGYKLLMTEKGNQKLG